MDTFSFHILWPIEENSLYILEGYILHGKTYPLGYACPLQGDIPILENVPKTELTSVVLDNPERFSLIYPLPNEYGWYLDIISLEKLLKTTLQSGLWGVLNDDGWYDNIPRFYMIFEAPAEWKRE